MLLRECLPDTACRSLHLPEGFYGLTTIVILISFLIMARVRTAEALRYQVPGEWVIVLGLDRCPEVKTLRRRVSLIFRSHKAVLGWQKALIHQWVEKEPEDWMTLAVDEHTKVYRRRKGKHTSPAFHLASEALSAGIDELLDKCYGMKAVDLSS